MTSVSSRPTSKERDGEEVGRQLLLIHTPTIIAELDQAQQGCTP